MSANVVCDSVAHRLTQLAYNSLTFAQKYVYKSQAIQTAVYPLI